MKFKIFLVIIFIFLANAAFAKTPREIYVEANLRYEDGNYKGAVNLYEALLEMDKASPEIFYNLGNSYFKTQQIGKAIVNYEKALRMAPRDSDIRMNLKIAKGMIVDKIEKPDKGFIVNVALFCYDRMNINELTVVMSALYFLIMALLIFSVFFAAKRKNIFYTTGALGVFFLIFLIFLVLKIYSENFIRTAVVISDKVDVRSGPKEDYLLQFSLHEGTILRVVSERQDWYEIDLSNDLKGWLPKDSIEII